MDKHVLIPLLIISLSFAELLTSVGSAGAVEGDRQIEEPQGNKEYFDAS